MPRAALLATVLALLLSACGQAAAPKSESKFKGEQAKVAKVVDDLAAAGRAGNADKICTEILSKALVTELKSAGGDCETEMDRAIKDASYYDLQVVSVKVNADTAT